VNEERTYTVDQITGILEEGMDAFSLGIRVGMCPYGDALEARMWRTGWKIRWVEAGRDLSVLTRREGLILLDDQREHDKALAESDREHPQG
jgi:hypothetical protein